PASTIQEVLAADDGTSPIAVAHEMARRNGTPVGGSALPRVFPVVGAALLALVDARRRPRAASLAFGAGLLIVMLPRMLGAAALGEGAASLPLVTLPYGVGAVGWIAANRAPLEISDVFRDARFVGHDWRKSHGLASFSGAPLVVDGRLLGVLALDARAPIELTATQRKGVAGFVEQAAAVLEEARRQNEARRQREELEASPSALDARVREMAALVSVAGILGATSDLTGALRLICRE